MDAMKQSVLAKERTRINCGKSTKMKARAMHCWTKVDLYSMGLFHAQVQGVVSFAFVPRLGTSKCVI